MIGYAALGCGMLGGCQTGNSADEQAMKALKTPADILRVADAARRDGDNGTAAQLYKRVLDQDSSNYQAHLGLGAALSGLGRTQDAVQEFRTAETLQPTRAEPELDLGRLYLLDHKPDLAVNEFDAALKLSPGAIAGWNGKGYALDLLERHQEAQEAYRTGLRDAPDDTILQNNLGLSLALSGNYDQAIKVLTTLVEEPGATARNRENLALALGLAGHMDDARWVVKDDLPESTITANLRFYEALRKLPPATQTAEVLGGGGGAAEADSSSTSGGVGPSASSSMSDAAKPAPQASEMPTPLATTTTALTPAAMSPATADPAARGNQVSTTPLSVPDSSAASGQQQPPLTPDSQAR